MNAPESEPVTRTIEIARDATVLSIAGSDPSGGAGLQMDIKACQQNGVYAMTAVSLVTVQNTRSIDRVEVLSADLLDQQIRAVIGDIPPAVIKTGALGNVANLLVAVDAIRRSDCPAVIDPVLISKHGDRLAGDEMASAYREELLPVATITTPNLQELEWLTETKLISRDADAIIEAASGLLDGRPRYVLVKVGNVDGQNQHILVGPEKAMVIQTNQYPDGGNHGAGCALSAVLAARLALASDGDDPDEETIEDAVQFAIIAVNHAIAIHPDYGEGISPVQSLILHDGRPV
ncbi:MAG: hydroxymethylpyrimidine/phosphomethylpyrimidine kinase [Planctomycetota bacterium]